MLARLLLCLLVATVVGEPLAHAIDLHDVVSTALQHNPTLGAAVADLDYARGNVLAARGLDDFVLDARADWNESRRPVVAGTPVQTTAYDDLLLSATLSRPLPTGGKIGLRVVTELTRSEFATDNMMGGFDASASTVWAPAVQLVFTHPLLRGIGLHTARAARFRNAALRDQATLSRAAAAAVLVRDVVAAYWELSYADHELAIRKASAVSAREQLEIVKANIEVGKQPPSASAEVQVAIALRDEEALLAEQAAYERGLDLQRLIGMPLDARTPRLAATESAPLPDVLPPTAEVLADARTHNPQLAAAHALARAATVDVEVTENGMLPQLDFSFAGGPQGNATNFGTALSQLGKFQAYGMTASLVLSEPLPRNYARGTRQSAQALLHKAKLGAEDIAQQIDTAVLRLVSQIDNARRRVEVLAATTDHAALDLEAERARFAVGRATNFDVLRRQEELAQTQLRRARAHTDYLKSAAALGAVTDEILDRYQVVLK